MFNKPNKHISLQQLQTIMDLTFATLDLIKINNRYDDICARAGWTIEMVFHDGDSLHVRERAWKVTEFFIETVGPENLVYWYEGYPKLLLSDKAKKEIALNKYNTLKNPSNYPMIFNLASGKPKPPDQWADDAQDFRMYCWIHDTSCIWASNHWTPGVGPAMSLIRMHIHAPWIKAQPPDRSAIWFTSRVVELMQPFWCCAGWGIMSAVEESIINPNSYAQQLLYPLLQRMPGLNAIDYISLSGTIFNNSMPSVNWLNYISDQLLDQLGGREALRQKTSSNKFLRVNDVGNCLCIRAGSIPVLGDTEGNVILQGYGEAARLLKPIRVKSNQNLFVAPPPYGSMDKKAWQLACDAYLSRFDLLGSLE